MFGRVISDKTCLGEFSVTRHVWVSSDGPDMFG